MRRHGVQIAIVVGGGNFWRGRTGEKHGPDAPDHMGMLATVINALALGDARSRQKALLRGYRRRLKCGRLRMPYIRGRAMHHLEAGRVVIFGCGTGNPFFSTDTAAALRAAEIDADIILLAKKGGRSI